MVIRSSLLQKEKLKPGMELRLDPTQRVALEVLGIGRRTERALETVSETPWSSIGGQDEAVQAIRDAIELPFLHRELFRRFDHAVPKGFLLHGPPGCGKTLLGKATAWNLRDQLRTQTGEDHPEFFLHVKGPEILNMWVGESERQVRDLFAQCRERARDGQLAFLFIDEAESILGTRRGSRSFSMGSTLVPMFCTEMDGLETLSNVVVILASNRPDLIDPAILRPGRIDRKIRVRRPDAAGARRIYEIYLREGLPLAESRDELARVVADAHYARTPANEFLEVIFRSGRREVLSRGDLSSGAIIAAIVERAKSFAIRRAISGKDEGHLTREDLLTALDREYSENDLFPSGDLTEDWLKLTDFDPENVARLAALFHVLAHGPGGVIDANSVDAAEAVISWHLHEARRLLSDLDTSTELAAAVRLDNWLIAEARRTGSHRIATNRVYRCGPSPVRDAKDMKTALATLAERRRARLVEDGRRRFVEVNPMLVSG